MTGLSFTAEPGLDPARLSPTLLSLAGRGLCLPLPHASGFLSHEGHWKKAGVSGEGEGGR